MMKKLERNISPCYVEGVFASDGILDLDIKRNMISQELGDQLGLSYEVLESGEKKVNKKLLMNLVGETNDDSIEKTKGYELEFYVEEKVKTGVVLGRPFLEHTRSIISYNIGEMTLLAEICVGNEQQKPFVIDAPKVKTGRKVSGEYKLSDVMSPGYFRA